MRLQGPALGPEPRPHALELDLGRQLPGLLLACAELEPDYAHQAPSLEGPELAYLQVETGQFQLVQPAGDGIHHWALDGSDETDGEMQVRGRCPPEVGRRHRAGDQVALQPVALRLRDGKPEERADSRRYFLAGAFFQCAGTQVLGAVGRHP